MTRFFPAVALVFMLPAHAVADLHPAVEGALCDAATQESAMPAQLDALLEGGLVEFSQVADVLTLRCEDDKPMLELLVEQRQAENLEYLVIDMGLDIEQPLSVSAERSVSLNDYLAEQARSGNEAVREFAREYLELFADKDFNPALWVSVQ